MVVKNHRTFTHTFECFSIAVLGITQLRVAEQGPERRSPDPQSCPRPVVPPQARDSSWSRLRRRSGAECLSLGGAGVATTAGRFSLEPGLQGVAGTQVTDFK